MYELSFSPGDIDFLREMVEFLDDVIEAVEVQDELKRQADCE